LPSKEKTTRHIAAMIKQEGINAFSRLGEYKLNRFQEKIYLITPSGFQNAVPTEWESPPLYARMEKPGKACLTKGKEYPSTNLK